MYGRRRQNLQTGTVCCGRHRGVYTWCVIRDAGLDNSRYGASARFQNDKTVPIPRLKVLRIAGTTEKLPGGLWRGWYLSNGNFAVQSLLIQYFAQIIIKQNIN